MSKHTVAEETDSVQIRELISHLVVDSSKGEAYSRNYRFACTSDHFMDMCRGGIIIASFCILSGFLLRWDDVWDGDPCLRPECRSFVREWLAARGMRGPLKEHQSRLAGKHAAQQEFDIATACLPDVIMALFEGAQPMDDEDRADNMEKAKLSPLDAFENILAICTENGISMPELAHHMLRVFGASNDDWWCGTKLQLLAEFVLQKIDTQDLCTAVEAALLGGDRYCKRGAAGLWMGLQSRMLASWEPSGGLPCVQAALDVLQESRTGDVRRRSVRQLIRLASLLPTEEIDRRLHALLRDPCPDVQRHAMLFCSRLKLPWTCELFMDVLHGVELPITPLPPVPEYEDVPIPPSPWFKTLSAATLVEVAALALAYAMYEPAVAEIWRLALCYPSSSVFAVAAALVGQAEHLQVHHFNARTEDHSLRDAAIVAVVRCQGRRGLDLLAHPCHDYYAGDNYAVMCIRDMLVANHAPGVDMLPVRGTPNALDVYRSWWSHHGLAYVTSLPPSPDGWKRRAAAVRHYHVSRCEREGGGF
jgi:hypothetical protein